MQLIAFASFKGGAGKTTALMAAASSFVHHGKRVALFEADENQPLDQWRQNAEKVGTWAENISLYPASDVERLDRAFDAAQRQGVDYALADLAGGGSDINAAVIINSQLVVVPTALSALDIDAALETMDYAAELLKRERGTAALVLLLNRLNVGKLTAGQKEDLELLETLPQLENRLHARDAFAYMKSKGLLHAYRDTLAADPGRRLMVRHLDTAIAEADLVAQDMIDALAEPAHAG